MQIQWFATFGLVAMACAFVLAGGENAAGRGLAPFGIGQHHGGHHLMFLDSDTDDTEAAAWDGRGDSLQGVPRYLRYLGEQHAASNDVPSQPYMMSYMDEVAQRLGISAGHFDLISMPVARGDSYGLSVGSMGRGRSLLNLHWHLGP